MSFLGVPGSVHNRDAHHPLDWCWVNREFITLLDLPSDTDHWDEFIVHDRSHKSATFEGRQPGGDSDGRGVDSDLEDSLLTGAVVVQSE